MAGLWRALNVTLVAGPLLLAGCVGSGTVHPGPSAGAWTATDAAPWFAYVRNAGLCGPICEAGVFVFEDGKAAWVTWGSDQDWGNGPGDVTSGDDPTMRPVDEPYRAAVETALTFLGAPTGKPLDVRVYNIVTATLPHGDHAAIRDRILSRTDRAEPPPRFQGGGCEDAGAVELVVQGVKHWDVTVPGHYGAHTCFAFDGPAGDWPTVDRQGTALWSWLEQPRWTQSHD